MTVDMLSACLRGEPPSQFPTDFVESCEAHGVVGLMRDAAERSRARFPDSVRDALARREAGLAAAELADSHELRLAVDALAEEGIDALLLKGSVLAYSDYAVPHHRPRTDTDVLVEARDVQRACRALERLGYRRHPGLSGDATMSQVPLVRETPVGRRHVIDLHWHISCRPAIAKRFPVAALFRNRRDIPPLGVGATGPSRVMSLLLAAIHPATHHPDEEKLIWHYDVHLLAGAMETGEWDELTRIARETGVGALVYRALEAAERHFATAIPRAALDELRRCGTPSDLRHFLVPDRRKLDDVWLDLKAMGLADRLRLAWRVLVPPREYMREWYGRGRQIPLPALYVLRAAKGLGKWLAR